MPGSKDPGAGAGHKVTALDELLDLLRRALEWLLSCVTCGCCPGFNGSVPHEVYEVELMEEERDAVAALLDYLNSDAMKKEPSFNKERLCALCILTYSGNVDLQKSAALCFAELSDKVRHPVTPEILEPLLVLLQSRDQRVLKASSLAVSNFILNGPDENRSLIIKCGGLPPLIDLLQSGNIEVTCNACGCITRLATNDEHKQAIIENDGMAPILQLVQAAPDVRIQRNACGALLNLTHLQTVRADLVQEGALPVLVEALHARDPDVQYYSAAALSNLAVTDRHRIMMVAIGDHDIIRRLIVLLKAKDKRVRFQACLALRNLASDGDNQILIVKLHALPRLHDLMRQADGAMLTAALACLRNLSIHRANEAGIIAETFLTQLQRLVVNSSNPEAQVHAAGTIRNLAAGEEIQKMTNSGCVEALVDVLLDRSTCDIVISEVTAALAVLADEDSTKWNLLQAHSGHALSRLIDLAVNSSLLDIRYNCAGTIGQLALTKVPVDTWMRCEGPLLAYLEASLCSDDSFTHIALWTLLQLLSYEAMRTSVMGHSLKHSVDEILHSDRSATIKNLAKTVQRKLQAAS